MIPQTSGATAVADEAALVTAISAMATAAGWSVTSAGTTPANSVWYQSTGEDGLHNIVGGLLPDTTARRMSAFIAADLDAFGIVSGNVGGYTNDDAVAVATPVQVQTNSAQWPQRDLGVSYRYIMAVNKNAIAVLVTYESGGNSAQGVIYIGTSEPSGARLLQVQATARIASVGAGSIGTQRLITLDRDIRRGLKDGTAYPSDPYTQALQFQCVAAGVGDAPDFAMLERIPIVAGTLSAAGAPTTFEIDVSTGVKLAQPGGRYASNRGAGDLVRLSIEPNIVLCGASATSGNPFPSNSDLFCALTAWDGYCGQRDGLHVTLANRHSVDVADHNPCEISNKTAYYPIYAVIRDIEGNLVNQVDGTVFKGFKNCGALHNLILIPNQNQPDLSFFRVSNDPARRYRIQEYDGSQGISGPALGFTSPVCYAVGAGW
jgi:hypothetical protein